MTHDHAEDFALCDTALRLPALGSIGLIGSSAKWTGFRRRLAEQGHQQAVIDRITSPIGLPEITGKEPAVIAVSVAASLLLAMQRQARTRHNRTTADTSSPQVDRPTRHRRHAREDGAAMTLYRATVIDTPGDPFAGDPADALAADQDGGVLVRDGIIVARGPFGSLHAEHPHRTGRPS